MCMPMLTELGLGKSFSILAETKGEDAGVSHLAKAQLPSLNKLYLGRCVTIQVAII